MEPRLMIRPQPRSHMPGPTRREQRKGALRLVAITASQSDSASS
jgi:hypothetical protein